MAGRCFRVEQAHFVIICIADGSHTLALRRARTVEFNVDAQRFYQRHAYPEVARLSDFYRPGDDLIIMTKRL